MKVFEIIKDLVFPQRCACCLKITEKNMFFCEQCISEIPFLEGIMCKKCGIALSPDFPSPICARCRENEFCFDRNIPLLEYTGFGRQCVLNMKYRSNPLIKDMGTLLANRLKEEEIYADTVTFVPMFKKDEIKSGTALTYILSEKVAREMGCLHEELLVKVRKTEKQKELTAKQRVLNVKNAYVAKGEISGKTVLLIDDVFTTGATMNECAKVLLKAGAARVYTATIGIRDRE